MESRIIRMYDIWCVVPVCSWRTPLTFNKQFLAIPVFNDYAEALAVYYDVLRHRRSISDKILDEQINEPMSEKQFLELLNLIREQNERLDKIIDRRSKNERDE